MTWLFLTNCDKHMSSMFVESQNLICGPHVTLQAPYRFTEVKVSNRMQWMNSIIRSVAGLIVTFPWNGCCLCCLIQVPCTGNPLHRRKFGQRKFEFFKQMKAAKNRGQKSAGSLHTTLPGSQDSTPGRWVFGLTQEAILGTLGSHVRQEKLFFTESLCSPRKNQTAFQVKSGSNFKTLFNCLFQKN